MNTQTEGSMWLHVYWNYRPIALVAIAYDQTMETHTLCAQLPANDKSSFDLSEGAVWGYDTLSARGLFWKKLSSTEYYCCLFFLNFCDINQTA